MTAPWSQHTKAVLHCACAPLVLLAPAGAGAPCCTSLLDLPKRSRRHPHPCRHVHALRMTPLPPLQVFPRGLMGALFPGFRGEVWMEPGKPATQVGV